MMVRKNRNIINQCILCMLFILITSISSQLQAQNPIKNFKSPLLQKIDSFSKDSLSLKIPPQSLMKHNYNQSYHDKLGAFCKIENRLLKQTNVPIILRLGSVDYVDKLEQKTPSYKQVEPQ